MEGNGLAGGQCLRIRHRPKSFRVGGSAQRLEFSFVWPDFRAVGSRFAPQTGKPEKNAEQKLFDGIAE
jgi:hypothetical protein